MNERTALWFWDIGGMKVDFGMCVDKITCYTCGATFTWSSEAPPQCPVCKSRGSCHSGPRC
jgi:rubrerythrin